MTKNTWFLIAAVLGCRAKMDATDTGHPSGQDVSQHNTETDPSSAPEEPAPPESPTPHQYDGEPDAPVYDRAALEAALDALLEELLYLNSDAPHTGYNTMLALADDDCPQWYEYDGNVYWLGGCTSSTGAHFDGYIFSYEYADEPTWGETSSMSGSSLNGQAHITAADGNRMDLAGYTYSSSGTVVSEWDTMHAWTSGVHGTFSWQDEAASDTWMSGPIEHNLELEAYLWYENQYRAVVSRGGLHGFTDGWDTAYLDEVVAVDGLIWDWPCTQETSGAVWVRSPEGYWYQVVFDIEGSTEDGFTMPEGTCDGCGTVYQDGVVVGEACTDFSRLLDWGEQPW